MTRKHFQQIADALARHRPGSYGTKACETDPVCIVWRRIRDDVATACYAANSNFDRSRFNRATEA